MSLAFSFCRPYAFAHACSALALCALASACGTDDTTSARSAAQGVGGSSTTGIPTGTAGNGLGECVGACIPSAQCSRDGTCQPSSQCDTDNDCPATDHNYTANGPRCVSICGDHRRCRTACNDGAMCPQGTGCRGLADDGTAYCE